MPPLKTGFADSYYNSVYRVAPIAFFSLLSTKPDRAKETLTVKRCGLNAETHSRDPSLFIARWGGGGF